MEQIFFKKTENYFSFIRAYVKTRAAILLTKFNEVCATFDCYGTIVLSTQTAPVSVPFSLVEPPLSLRMQNAPCCQMWRVMVLHRRLCLKALEYGKTYLKHHTNICLKVMILGNFMCQLFPIFLLS